ncbi:hypothetical protein KIN20_003825 [Parelaphostrongylus tenuis]|uniref:Uncharacterized protein n=1 Tax=Parelaphostrongylus tenuis TaxID=148309 RepID=A0AAD5LXX9_PARTN|nr:hypothetical protein KIN20_003825 [Parelaphostrongylus tenuis]
MPNKKKGKQLLTDGFRNQTNPNSNLLRTVARWGPHVNVVCVIVVPILLVIISNTMLIYTIRQRQRKFIAQSSVESESHLSGSQSRTEHRVTTTVCAIVTCFHHHAGTIGVHNNHGRVLSHSTRIHDRIDFYRNDNGGVWKGDELCAILLVFSKFSCTSSTTDKTQHSETEDEEERVCDCYHFTG